MPTTQLSLDELFPEEFGVEPEPEPKPKPEPSKKDDDLARKLPSRIYWQYALDVVNKWAKYQAKKKLLINATHEETRHRVQGVVNDEKYYGGSVTKIRESRDALSYQLDRLLSEFVDICEFFEVEPVSREWLYDHLEDAKDYASYRGKCQTRLKKPSKYPAVSLRDL